VVHAVVEAAATAGAHVLTRLLLLLGVGKLDNERGSARRETETVHLVERGLSLSAHLEANEADLSGQTGDAVNHHLAVDNAAKLAKDATKIICMGGECEDGPTTTEGMATTKSKTTIGETKPAPSQIPIIM